MKDGKVQPLYHAMAPPQRHVDRTLRHPLYPAGISVQESSKFS